MQEPKRGLTLENICRRMLVEQLKAMGQKSDPDVMIEEKCAITTRVSPSFLRIGHVDLCSRRVTQKVSPPRTPFFLRTHVFFFCGPLSRLTLLDPNFLATAD